MRLGGNRIIEGLGHPVLVNHVDDGRRAFRWFLIRPTKEPRDAFGHSRVPAEFDTIRKHDHEECTERLIPRPAHAVKDDEKSILVCYVLFLLVFCTR